MQLTKLRRVGHSQKPTRGTQSITRSTAGRAVEREAMATPKRMQITIETPAAPRLPGSGARKCGPETELDLGDVQAITGIPHRILSDAAASHGWHVSQAPDGSTLICLEAIRSP